MMLQELFYPDGTPRGRPRDEDYRPVRVAPKRRPAFRWEIHYNGRAVAYVWANTPASAVSVYHDSLSGSYADVVACSDRTPYATLSPYQSRFPGDLL